MVVEVTVAGGAATQLAQTRTGPSSDFGSTFIVFAVLLVGIAILVVWREWNLSPVSPELEMDGDPPCLRGGSRPPSYTRTVRPADESPCSNLRSSSPLLRDGSNESSRSFHPWEVPAEGGGGAAGTGGAHALSQLRTRSCRNLQLPLTSPRLTRLTSSPSHSPSRRVSQSSLATLMAAGASAPRASSLSPASSGQLREADLCRVYRTASDRDVEMAALMLQRYSYDPHLLSSAEFRAAAQSR